MLRGRIWADRQWSTQMGNAADERITERAWRNRPGRAHGYEKEMCTMCGQYKLVRNGAELKCDSCGASSGSNDRLEPGGRDVDLTGTIRAVTHTGYFGIVELSEPYEGKQQAALNMDTMGLRELYVRLGGSLVRGATVRIKRLELGSEAHRITLVE